MSVFSFIGLAVMMISVAVKAASSVIAAAAIRIAGPACFFIIEGVEKSVRGKECTAGTPCGAFFISKLIFVRPLTRWFSASYARPGILETFLPTSSASLPAAMSFRLRPN